MTTQGPIPTGSLLVVDFETSGLSVLDGHRAVWLGAVVLNGTEVHSTHSLAVAGTEGMGFYGDAPGDVQRLTREELVAWLEEAMGRAAAVVAHNASFDRRFAEAEFAAVGKQMPDTPWLDTLALARKLRPDFPNHRLATCASELGFQMTVEHQAPADAEACAHVFTALRTDSDGRVSSIERLLRIAAVNNGNTRRESDGSLIIDIGSELGLDRLLEDLLDEGLDLEAFLASRPICGDLRAADITDQTHLDAHEAVKRLYDLETLEEQIASLECLLQSGCPNAGSHWRNLPYIVGDTGAFDAALLVLSRFRDARFGSREDIQSVTRHLLYASDEVSDHLPRLMAAHSEFGAWLRTFAPCDLCIERDQPDCSDFDLALAAARAAAHRLDGWSSVLGEVGAQAFLTDKSITERLPAGDAQIAHQVLLSLGEGDAAAKAVLLCASGHQQERAGHLTVAQDLLERAIATGEAPLLAYDRLSLIFERAKDFHQAARVATCGLARAEFLGRDSQVLSKRAARCSAKAAASR